MVDVIVVTGYPAALAKIPHRTRREDDEEGGGGLEAERVNKWKCIVLFV